MRTIYAHWRLPCHIGTTTRNGRLVLLDGCEPLAVVTQNPVVIGVWHAGNDMRMIAFATSPTFANYNPQNREQATIGCGSASKDDMRAMLES